MHRNIRMDILPYSPRRGPNPILLHLYKQGLQMGLPQHQALRILTIGQHPRASSAYRNPALGSVTATGVPYGYPPYRGPTANVEYPYLPAPQAYDQYGQNSTRQATSSGVPGTMAEGITQYSEPGHPTQTTSSVVPQVMSDGTTYYADGNHITQAMSSATPQMMDTAYYHDPSQASQFPVYHEPDVAMEPIYGAGNSHNYQYGSYAPLHPIPGRTEPEYLYSHELYLSRSHPPDFTHGHGHGHQ